MLEQTQNPEPETVVTVDGLEAVKWTLSPDKATDPDLLLSVCERLMGAEEAKAEVRVPMLPEGDLPGVETVVGEESVTVKHGEGS